MVEDVVSSFILFAAAVWFLIKIKRYPAGLTLLYALLSLFLFELLAIVVDGAFSLFGLPNILSANLGMVCGYLLGRKRRPRFWAVGISLLLLCACIGYVTIGFKYWTNYFFQDSFTGKVNLAMPHHNWFFYEKSSADTIRPEELEGRITVLDFWATSCSACRKEFPEFEQLYRRYKADTNLYFQVVNVPISRGSLERQDELIRETRTRYSFPMVTASDSTTAAFTISSYPVYLVLVQDTIRFRTIHLSLLEQYLSALRQD